MSQLVAVRLGGRLQRPGQWQFAVDERGKGRLNFYCANDAKGAESRSDAWKLASYEVAGNVSDEFVRPERTMASAVPESTEESSNDLVSV